MVEYAHWLEYIAYKRAKAKTNLQAIFMKQPQLFQVNGFFLLLNGSCNRFNSYANFTHDSDHFMMQKYL